MDKTNHHNSEQSGDAINRAEEGSVCRAERSGADRASGVGALPGADEAPMSDQWLHLAPVHAPDALLPTVLARLGLTKHSPPGSSVEALLTALNNPAWRVRAAAARTIAEHGEKVPTEPLLVALHDPAWQVRTAAVQALGVLGQDVPIEILVVALADEDASVRAAAIRALGGLGERAPLEPLLTALQDPDWLVREIAIMMLGTLGERVPIEPLVVAMQDENAFVRQAAALALAQRQDAAISTSSSQGDRKGRPIGTNIGMEEFKVEGER